MSFLTTVLSQSKIATLCAAPSAVPVHLLLALMADCRNSRTPSCHSRTRRVHDSRTRDRRMLGWWVDRSSNR
ncbi:hypothetical protein I551_1152 [Mycobacterium ulcerans str. Harvey]|uniref:Secreted protein n=1 Tax=Mycobacterium ulcerans str. Harvey TaxID=1299332 RepID=A0ABN0R5E1_MYCUL|nr:hypothetical protein I551_1152 [Mycobacterium ulcerans str. Harvey]